MNFHLSKLVNNKPKLFLVFFFIICIHVFKWTPLTTFHWNSLELDTSSTGPQEQTQKMLFVADRMEERRRRVSEVCHAPANQKYLREQNAKYLKVGINSSLIDVRMPYRPEFLVHRKRKLGWCKVPKASSASMVVSLLQEFGDPHTQHQGIWGHVKLASLMPPLKEGEEFDHLSTFIIVRHPFSRILSAFRDKFHNRTIRNQFQKFKRLYGTKIIRKYRKSPIVNSTYQDMPTFREFCEYILDTPVEDYNEHWLPYFISCAPCHIGYNAILQTETLTEDISCLSRMTGLTLELKHNHRTPIRKEDLTELSTDQSSITNHPFKINASLKERNEIYLRHLIEKNFYATLSKNILEKMFNIYRVDFEMFGYSVYPYDLYVNNEKKNYPYK